MSTIVATRILQSGGRRIRSRWRQRLTSSMVPSVLALVLWGYIVSPLVATLEQSIAGAGGAFSEYLRFFEAGLPESVLGSLGISFLSVISAGLTGVLLAVLFNRWDFPMRKACKILVLVPIALPPLIGVEAFVKLYGIGGTFPQLLGILFHTRPARFALRGMTGVLLVHTLTMYPYFYLTVAAALKQADDSLEEAAYSLGASGFHVWTRVLLPILTPALTAAALLTFMSSMASYTAPLLFGADNVMTNQIMSAKTNGDLRLASVVSVILSVISIIFLVMVRAYEQRSGYSTGKGLARKQQRVTGGFWKMLIFAIALFASLFLILPIAIIFVLAFSVNGSWQTSPLPSKYTTQNFVSLLSDPRYWEPVGNSLLMSSVAVGGAIALGVAGAYVIARLRFRGKAVIDISMMLPWALPGTVVGFNLIQKFNSPSLFSLGTVLVNTFWIVPLAYVVRFSPLIFRSTAASLTQLDPAVEEAARSLGSNWFYTWRRIVLPLLYRGIAAGSLLAFVGGIGEFVATILLYTPAYRPLSIAINDEIYLGNYGTAAAWGVVQVLLVLLVLLVSRLLEEREQGIQVL